MVEVEDIKKKDYWDLKKILCFKGRQVLVIVDNQLYELKLVDKLEHIQFKQMYEVQKDCIIKELKD